MAFPLNPFPTRIFPGNVFPAAHVPVRFMPWTFPTKVFTVPGSSQSERIHNALKALAAGGAFVLVTYAEDGERGTGATVAPASIRCNDVTSTFQDATRNRRQAMQDRRTWKWKLYLGFHQEVSCEAFEEELLESPKRIPATDDLRQVQIRLVDASYTHPQQHGAAAGTTAVYTFEASQSPV